MNYDPVSHNDVLRFGAFRLDRSEGLSRLHDSGQWLPVVVGSRAVDILRVLAERRGQLATKQALMDAVWPGIAVEDANLTVQISALRRILDAGRTGESCIQTVVGRGYRFLPTVTTREADSSFANSTAVAHAPVSDSRPPLSIVVMPFMSLNSDKEAEHLAVAITDNLSTDLSRLPGVFVVAHGRAGAYEVRSMDARQAGGAFGVNHVIQGSIRGTAVRTEVNVRLVDVETNAHIWAERFDIDRTCIADAHDEITGRLVRIVYLKLIEDANRRIEALPRRDWTATDLIIHGATLVGFRPATAENRRDAMRCYEQALGMNPGSIHARIGIAFVLIANILDGWSQSATQDVARAEQLLIDVLRHDGDNPDAHCHIGMLRRVQGRLSDSRIELEMAIGLRPNYIQALGQLGLTLAYLGQPEAAIPHLERCLRLAPHDLSTPTNHSNLGLYKLLLGHIEEAIICLRKARAGNPRLYFVHLFLAAALGLRGELDEAGDSLRRALETMPEMGSQDMNIFVRLAGPECVKLYRKTIYAGLLLAGLPRTVPNFVALPDE